MWGLGSEVAIAIKIQNPFHEQVRTRGLTRLKVSHVRLVCRLGYINNQRSACTAGEVAAQRSAPASP
jgi:hypothetical protein